MKFNYVEVEESVKEKAKICAEKAGYEFLYIVKHSNHPNDHYLYIVVGKGGYDNGYCVWLFNSSVNKGDGSLGDGVYDMTFVQMLEELSKRVRDINM
jgi:hypothetical protein